MSPVTSSITGSVTSSGLARAKSAAPSWVLDTSAPMAWPPTPLDGDQRQVLSHRTGALLVLAGPGTGKTTTIVEAIADRLTESSDGLRPEHILALTFGRRAAEELRDRVVRRIGGGAVPLVSTFHAFAFGLVLEHAVALGATEPPKLLSGAEDDVRVRELLLGAIEDGLPWPEDLAGATQTLALANEIRAVLARSRELDLEPEQLARIGRDSGRPAWAALGVLAAQEDAVATLQGVMDYPSLLQRSLEVLADSSIRARLPFRAIFVDELQDTDPTQLAILELLVKNGASLVAVGDPDQSIYRFRGADPRALADFGSRFGAGAPIVLGTTRRFGANIRRAGTAALGRRMPVLSGLGEVEATRHRNPTCVGEDAGTVRLVAYDSDATRAAWIAHDIREAHVHGGLDWSQMAVLVRSARHIPVIQRALLRAGVPAAIARDEIPLRLEPAVATLLDAASACSAGERLTSRQANDLLTGPLGGFDTSMLRALGRALRAAHREADDSAAPPSSDELLRLLVAGVLSLPGSVGRDLADLVERLLALLEVARAQIDAGRPPADVLWTLWNGTVSGRTMHAWPARLRAAALAGSRSADHDLDALMALFDTAERMESRFRGRVGMETFLASLREQEIPAEAVAERAPRHDAVRLLTAHRAKGLEWQAVWVAGVEEGEWPDLRARGSVLEADRLTPLGLGDPLRPADLLAEERRLFYVAVTRARSLLTVTAVEAGEDGQQPSRFLGDLSRELEQPIDPVHGRPRYFATLAGLVAQLREIASDEGANPSVRDAAISRLASLAEERDGSGELLVPGADPSRWWGVLPLTEGTGPLREDDVPIPLSGSALESLLTCPLRWFLEKEAHADVERASATAFGSIVHAVAEYVAKGEVPPVLDDADALVDRVWSDLRFDAPWQSQSERRDARMAIERFLTYHLNTPRALEGIEDELKAFIDVPGPDGRMHNVRLRGFMDRIERDDQGRLVPIDLKNMRRPTEVKELPTHAQLGIYQVLIRESGGEPGGAALIQLRVSPKGEPHAPVVQEQEPLPAEQPTWIEFDLGRGAGIIRDEAFDARTNKWCRYCAYRTSCPTQSAGEQVIP